MVTIKWASLRKTMYILLMISATCTMFFYADTGWHHLPANTQGNQSDIQGRKTNPPEKMAAATEKSSSHCSSQRLRGKKKKEWLATKWLVNY